jgi:hypothetical protein
MNAWRLLLANICFWFHWVWIIALLILAAVSVKYTYLSTMSLIVTGTTIMSQIVWLGCPLIQLEHSLRRTEVSFSGSFICSFLYNVFGIKIPSWVIFVSLIGIFILNIILHTNILKRIL